MRWLGRGSAAALTALAIVSLAHASELRAPVVAQGRADTRASGQTGAIPSIGATVSSLQFFEGPSPLPRDPVMKYGETFAYVEARYVYWELRLAHPAPGRPASFTIEEVWQGPGIVHRATRTFTLEPEWTSSVFYGSARLVETKSVDTAGPVASPEECARQRRMAGPFAPDPPACSQTRAGGVHVWPRGGYRVELIVDGSPVAGGAFQMR